MTDRLKQIVYSPNSVEFVTVGVEYCAYLENMQDIKSQELIDKLTKLLPLLYLKASLVPETEIIDDNVEITVTEYDYNYILYKLQEILGNEDSYLEVFVEDMKYSETPILVNISEDLSDIYQDIKNFISVYERGITENMNDALYVCMDNFKTYWGQKLVNVLRALHALKYADAEQEFNDENDIMEGYSW